MGSITALVLLTLSALVSSTYVTVWEEDSEAEVSSVKRINPRVTSCLPKSAYDDYPMLVIPYGPITEWPLDGSSVNITLPFLETAHGVTEKQKVRVAVNKVENLLHGDRASRSICPPSVKQACFWAWSPRPSLSIADVVRNGETVRTAVIRLRRHLEPDNYAYAHEDLFRYFREPVAAIRSVCDTQPSTLQRYATLFGVSRNETEANLCVYVSLYAVRYVVQWRSSKAKLKRTWSSSEAASYKADEQQCDTARPWLRLASSATRTKTFRFLLRLDTLLVGDSWRWHAPDGQKAAEQSAAELAFVTNDFFAVEQRPAEQNDNENASASNDTVAPASSACGGCYAKSPPHGCRRMLAFADAPQAPAVDATWRRSFVWNHARVEFDTSKWQPVTTTTVTMHTSDASELAVNVAAIQPNVATETTKTDGLFKLLLVLVLTLWALLV